MPVRAIFIQSLRVGVVLSVLGATSVAAKLPAPDASPEAKNKRAEAAARTAWSNKVADFQLCKWQDRVAGHYQGDLKKRGATSPDAAANAMVTPPACVDPGPFVFTPDAAPAPAVAPAAAAAPAPTPAAPAPTAAPSK